MRNRAGLYSKHVPIVPVLVKSWSGQVNSGSRVVAGLGSSKKIKKINKNYHFGLNSLLHGNDFQIHL